MKLELTGLRTLNLEESEKLSEREGFQILEVTHCAICKTDAKMWNEGHRDLIFPRVPGHEIAAMDPEGARYTLWPGQSCGDCEFCTTGRENLCEEMKIMGFHHDGGFSASVLAPEKALIPIDKHIPAAVICFAEPVGCAINVLEKVSVTRGDRVVIFGGGTLGLLLALICQSLGAHPTVIEKDERKITRTAEFCRRSHLRPVKDTTESDFDIAINACPDPIAFSLCLTKLKKGGRLGFFSGLKKNETLESNLLNLIHYKEISIHGAYGLTRQHMVSAMTYLDVYSSHINALIDREISLAEVPEALESVLAGSALKIIIDLKKSNIRSPQAKPEKSIMTEKTKTSTAVGYLYQKTNKEIAPLSDTLLPDAQFKIDNKTKPLGALGKLETLAVQAALVQNTLNPTIDRKSMLVFGADHGITEEGISAYPSEVTFQMVENFFNGGAAINVICAAYDIDVKVVDMGVKGNFQDHPILVKRKIAEGTQNFAITPAMTELEAIKAIEAGMALFLAENQTTRIDILGVGEIGIGNTTAAAAIISAITGLPPEETAGRGTGLDDKGLKHKADVLRRALDLHQPDPTNGLEILTKVGGFEIGGIVGAILAAASKKTMVVLDGVISTAAGLIAYVINPDIKAYLISGHKSVEVAQKVALAHMGLSPMIDLDMRLGEGTGAAITMDLVETACAIMRDMASFEEAGVSTKSV